MKRTTFAAVLLASTAMVSLPAQAEFILQNQTFVDLSGTGFGVLPPLLTLQAQGTTTFESGAVISVGGTQGFLSPVTITGTPATGFDVIGVSCDQAGGFCAGGLNVNQSNLTNIATLGWVSGAEVGLGLNTNQTGSTTGLFFNELVLNIFDANGNIVGTFGGNDAILISQQQLADQQGQGQAVFNLGLTGPEQLEFDQMLAANPGNLFAGLAADFGCQTGPNCIGRAIDGAESFQGFAQSVAVPGPIVGAGLPGLIAACMTMLGFNYRRRRRNGATLPA
jgi:hypothetical protein